MDKNYVTCGSINIEDCKIDGLEDEYTKAIVS